MKLIKVFSILVGLLAVGCTRNGIPLIGMDDHNKYYEYMVDDKEYAKNLKMLFESSDQAIKPALEESVKKSSWSLSTVVVGLGLKGEAGVGPVLTISVSPRFRLAYSNSPKPYVP
jgi:hypothetical protein